MNFSDRGVPAPSVKSRGESTKCERQRVDLTYDDTETSGMKVWEAHVLLVAVRRGMPAEEAKYLIAELEAASKKVLRSIGMTHEAINMDCPNHIVDDFLTMAEEDPDRLEREIAKSVHAIVSRN